MAHNNFTGGDFMVQGCGDEVTLEVDAQGVSALEGKPLIEVLERLKSGVAHVCYHPVLEPIQTCDTCLALLGTLNDREVRCESYAVLNLLKELGTHLYNSRT